MAGNAVLERPDNSPGSLPRFLTVRQLAGLLHINEKKVYQLAGEGSIPCTKITGKWLFPTPLIENWIFENSHGGVMTDRLLISGSEDVLVQRTCSRVAIAVQDSAMIGYSPCGTRHGLRMLETGRVDACLMYWGAAEKNAYRHRGLLRGYRNHHDWVIARLLQRTQGLAITSTAANAEHTVDSLLDNRSLRWALRGEFAGSTRILQDLLSVRHIDPETLLQATLAESERSAVAAVSTGRADITCCTQSVAAEYNLAFVSVAMVALDLVLTRKTYFRTLLQAFLTHLRAEATLADAQTLGGYELFDDIELMTV